MLYTTSSFFIRNDKYSGETTMEQITNLKEMHDKLNEEKKQLRIKIRECRDQLTKWEKDLKYYEGAEDSVDIMLKMICENAINNIPTDAAVTNGTAAPIEEQPAPRATPSRSRSTNSRGKK